MFPFRCCCSQAEDDATPDRVYERVLYNQHLVQRREDDARAARLAKMTFMVEWELMRLLQSRTPRFPIRITPILYGTRDEVKSIVEKTLKKLNSRDPNSTLEYYISGVDKLLVETLCIDVRNRIK